MEKRETTTIYIVKFDIWLRKDDRIWLSNCPSLGLITQAPTKKDVLVAIEEAVSLWFQSCIDRGVLREALQELGFKRSPWDRKSDSLPESNFIAIRESIPEEILESHSSFSLDPRKNAINGVIPAYIAKEQLGRFIHEAC